MQGLTRTPLAEQVADALLERIRAGEWPLGSKLPGEHALGAQLGVGRSTVREAIRRLAGQGVLSTRQGSGVFVAALDATTGWQEALLRADINAVIEARVAVEVEAAALAAERRTPAQMRAIRQAGRRREAERTGMEQHVDADLALHRSIVAAASSPLLAELFQSLTPRIRPAMIDLLRLQGEFGSDADHAAHLAVIEAIAARDPGSAATLARAQLLALKSN